MYDLNLCEILQNIHTSATAFKLLIDVSITAEPLGRDENFVTSIQLYTV